MYKKVVSNGYILGVGEVSAGGNITQEEYSRLTEILSSMPSAPDGYYYALSADEQWILLELPEEPEPELSDEEALAIILGEGGEDA